VSHAWKFSPTPEDAYLEWVAKRRLTFSSPDWAGVLAKLGAEVFFAWNDNEKRGLLVPVFRQFGLKIGFLGFPVANGPTEFCSVSKIKIVADEASRTLRLNLVRATRVRSVVKDQLAVSGRPEAWLKNLQEWAPTSKRLRKDLGFARRATSKCRIEIGGAYAEACFTLYKETVASRGGKLRYTLPYFQALEDLSIKTNDVTVLVCIDDDNSLCGFATLVLDGGVGHYLHGAASLNGRQKGVSDLLIEQLVEISTNAGCSMFTMMSSPWEQEGLKKFKEKWSDSSGLTLTYDLPHGLFGKAIKAYSSWQSRADRINSIEWIPNA